MEDVPGVSGAIWSLHNQTYIPSAEAGSGSNREGRVSLQDARVVKMKELGGDESRIQTAEYPSMILWWTDL